MSALPNMTRRITSVDGASREPEREHLTRWPSGPLVDSMRRSRLFLYSNRYSQPPIDIGDAADDWAQTGRDFAEAMERMRQLHRLPRFETDEDE